MAKYEVESASKYEVEPAAPSKYTVEAGVDTTRKGPSLPQDQRSQEIPSLRQGSPSDVHASATERDFGPPKPRRESTTPEFYKPTYLPGPLRTGVEWYQRAIVDPIKSRLYGETLPPEMAHPFVSSTPEERQSYQTTETLKTLGSDPAMAVPFFGAAKGLTRLARPAGQPPVEIIAPVVPPRTPPAAAVPIQELARKSPAQAYEQYTAPQAPQAGPIGLDPRRVELGQLPTGSLERSLEPLPETKGKELPLRTLPTGSMLRVQKPRNETTAAPVGPHYPQVPAEQGVPREIDLLASRRLHGNQPSGLSQAPEGPPRPFLRSAEDLLAERLKDRPSLASLKLPDLPSDPPELTQLMLQSEQMGPRGTISAQVPGERTLTQSSPSLVRRLFQQSFDTLDDMGPYTRGISDILRHSFDYSETGTRQNFLDYLQLIRSIWGEGATSPSRVLSQKAKSVLSGDWASVLNSSIGDFGLTKKEQAALVELHEVGSQLDAAKPPLSPAVIQSLVSPKAWETLKAELLDPRVQRLYQEGWQILSGRASSLPSVQGKARVHDPISGQSFPVGKPSPFWPHQPVRNEIKRLLTEANMRSIYNERGYKAQGIDYDTFVQNFTSWIETKDPTTQLRRFAGIENVRHLDMLKDAKAHNRTVADSLEYYGYETDPLRALLRHNLYALKRSVFLENEEALTNLRQQVRVEYGQASKEHAWVEKVIQRAQGISEREDIITKSTHAWEIAQSIMYPAFLKASWAQNFLLQPTYVQMVTGIRPIAQAVWRRYGKMLGMVDSDILEAAERSGANFPSFMAKYHLPEGPFQQYNKTALELDMFAQSDWYTRTWAGEVFIPHAENLIRKWYQDPANPKWQRALQEGNLNPKELMQKMSAAPRATWDASGMPPIPQEALQRYAQAQANRAMGRTGVRSLPLWMSGDSQTAKLFMMLHRQITSNEGVFWRNISNAPTAGVGLNRALRAVFGAELAGTMYQGVTNWIVGNNFFDVNEPLKKSFHGNKEAAFAVKALLLGLGTFTSGIILSGINAHAGNYGGMTYGILSPAASTFIDEIVVKAEQGKLGEVAARLNPSQVVDVLIRRKAKEEKRKKQAGMPGQGLNTGVGLSQ